MDDHSRSGSPLFEPDDGEFSLDASSTFPETDVFEGPMHVAYMYPGAAEYTVSPIKHEDDLKRRRAEVDPQTTAHFDRLTQEYTKLDKCSRSRHIPASEPLPDMPAYHPSFPAAQSRGIAIVHKLQQVMIASGETDSESKYMMTCLKGIAAPTNPGLRFVCVYGNCGVGKSSFINALLGIEDASLKTGDGGSGTLVLIELAQGHPTQPCPFAAAVCYEPLPICEKIIRDIFADYYESRIAVIDESDDVSPLDLGKGCLKRLLALFADKPEFGDEAAAVRFLGRAKSKNDPVILNKMVGWVQHIHGQLSSLGSVIKIYTHTSLDLNRALEPFSQHCEDPEIKSTSLKCSVYPLVRKVRKCIFNPILDKGIVLVDLPGVSDTDQRRVSHAKAYFRDCHQAIVVHGIERAEDDRHLEEMILDIHRRKRSGSVAVVLSRSDDIEFEGGSRIKYSPRQQEQLASLELIDEEIDDKIKTYHRRRSNYRSKDFVEMMEEHELNLFLKKHIKTMRTEILAEARNTKIRKNLQAWYSSKTKDPLQLPVFCVSSKCYMAHVKGFPTIDPPLLSAEMTEIPAVRSYFYQLAGNGGKVEALKHHYFQIRSLLTQMELSCSGFQPMNHREHLLEAVINAQNKVVKLLHPVRQEFHKRSIQPVLIRFSAQQSWIEKAGQLWDKWATYNAHGHLAFVKHNGNWKTAACGKANWNENLLEIASDDVQPLVDQLQHDAGNMFKVEAIGAMSDLLDEMEQNMKGIADISQSTQHQHFFDSLSDRKKTLASDIEKATEEMVEQISNDALNDGKGSPFTTRMAKIYAASLNALPDKANRSKKAARCAYLRTAVCTRKNGPYLAIRSFMSKGLDVITEDADKKMQAKCEKVMRAIRRDFCNAFPENEECGVEGTRRRDILGAKVAEGREALEGKLKMTLAECGIEVD